LKKHNVVSEELNVIFSDEFKSVNPWRND